MPSCSLLKPHGNDTEGKLTKTKRRGDRSIPSQTGELAQLEQGSNIEPSSN